MRVLVACEFSGIVRDAFGARGHDAWSCDLIPTELPGPHLQCDVFTILDRQWDLMIAHPECTHLAISGGRWMTDHWVTKKSHPNGGYWYDGANKRAQQSGALEFVKRLWDAPIPKIALENPIGSLPRLWRKWSQVIHPWQFGEKQCKATCLWLKDLPLLKHTNIVGPPPEDKELRKSWEKVWREPPGPNQARNRSRTFQGIANAMAEQWG
jgi:hypothetical protein